MTGGEFGDEGARYTLRRISLLTRGNLSEVISVGVGVVVDVCESDWATEEGCKVEEEAKSPLHTYVTSLGRGNLEGST